ncbi:MAG: DUF1579 domain-containing protein [bacterium]|nr:DUF1579 domain-containing protein [bacterium]
MMKRNMYRVFFIFLMLAFYSLVAAETPVDPMKKLEPFVGKWKTVSMYTQGALKGIKIPGDLEYRWILGKSWMFVEFVGHHPKRPYWEAYAMIKYDKAKGRYISHDFFNADDPVLMTGFWLSPQTLRFEIKSGKGKSGIDYTLKEDGTLYQENWSKSGTDEAVIRLKTWYTRVK